MINVSVFLLKNRIISKLVVRDLTNTSKLEYCFFLYKDGFVYKKNGYSDALEDYFNLEGESGLFHIKCFIRDSETMEVESHKSKKVSVNMEPYNIDKWNREVIKTNLESFEKEVDIYDCIYQFTSENSAVDILFDNLEKLKPETGVLVCFTAAIGSRELKQAPFFSGTNIAKKMGMPLIAIADSSLSISNKLALSWYAGNQDIQNLPIFIANILDLISNKLNVKLTIFGGSGGGFAALAIVKKMSCCTNVAVWNPQTSISKYTKQEVINYLETCYPSYNLDNDLYKTLDYIGITHDLLATYSKCEKIDNILFLQNIGDTHHIEKHAIPFMESLQVEQLNQYTYVNTKAQTITFWLKNWGKGHIAPSDDIVIKILSGLVNNKSSKEVALLLE